MTKNIHLRFDEKFFFKMKGDKFAKEKAMEDDLTWEEYIKLLFGFKR